MSCCEHCAQCQGTTPPVSADDILTDLSISVEQGEFTDPNTRVVKLLWRGKMISSDEFSVVQTREYEG